MFKVLAQKRTNVLRDLIYLLDQYSTGVFIGILINTRATKRLTAGKA
jgi:hypothetical protein